MFAMNSQLQLILQQAIQAFQERNFDDAEKKLRYFLRIIPKYFDAIHLLAVVSASQGKYEESITYYKRALELNKKDPSVLNNLGSSLNALGKNSEALLAFKGSLKIDPAIPEFWYNVGNTLCDLERYEEAVIYYERSLEINPEYYQALNNFGLALFKLNRHSESLTYFDRAYLLNEYFLDCLINKGEALKELKRYEESLACNQRVLTMNPEYVEAWSNQGLVLNELKRYDEAMAHYDKALSLKPDYHEAWSNKGVTLSELKRYDEAMAHYDKALSLKPDYHEAWSNQGLVLNELKRYDEAMAHYDKALSLKPDYHEAWSNKGVTLSKLKRYDEAMAHYDKALSLKPDYHEAWSNKGVTLSELKRYDETMAHYDKALSLKPDIDWAFGDLRYTKMKICSWSGLAESLRDISKKVVANEKVAQPFPLLALNDDTLLHKKSSEIYIQSRYPFNPTLELIRKHAINEKIRIGYFSTDFKNHPVALLIAELFETHDRNRFEIYAFSLENATDEMRGRLVMAFDRFIDAESMSDVEIAQASRGLSIDIAVDLTGFTQNSRTGIFAHRAAPIQVNYLGYPGTMGADYLDYIIADKTLISPEVESCYSEKVIYLPNSYQVNDRKRIISDKQFTRQELGLSEHGFVFCCFNNNYKILPATFEGWMRILKAVEGSVLWLFQDNSWAVENLKKETEKQGIDSQRLFFAERMPLAEHLARHRQADLFLDTFPYNAHTTASDALWTGLPVLTLMGRSFASRVAASLLNAVGLPELITSTQEEYEALAIELALNPHKLADIKLKLAKNRLTTPLFDTPLFTKNLESAYIKMYERYQDDLEPDHITIF
jgi:predicted O-linked N-acetylglucosamine transferase (SPINDLY family)